MEELINFINELATYLFYGKTNLCGKDLFRRGGCWEFYLIMKNIIGNGITPYIHKNNDHIAINYNGTLYDSNGKLKDKDDYRPVTAEDRHFIDEYFGEQYRYLNIKKIMIDELNKIDIKKIMK